MSLSEKLSDLRKTITNKFNSINVYQCPLVNPQVGMITDEIGTYEILDNSATSSKVGISCQQEYALIANTGGKNYTITGTLCSTLTRYINLKNGNPQNVDVVMSSSGGHTIGDTTFYIGASLAPETLILPNQIIGYYPCFIATHNAFARGLYLNRYGFNVLSTPNWIVDDRHITAKSSFANIYCPSGYTYSPIYLNRLYLSMIAFDTFIDKLGARTSTGKIYVGEANLNRISTETINKANAKGWVIS